MRTEVQDLGRVPVLYNVYLLDILDYEVVLLVLCSTTWVWYRITPASVRPNYKYRVRDFQVCACGTNSALALDMLNWRARVEWNPKSAYTVSESILCCPVLTILLVNISRT